MIFAMKIKSHLYCNWSVNVIEGLIEKYPLLSGISRLKSFERMAIPGKSSKIKGTLGC